MTSAPWAWISRRMMLIAASWPSNSEAAVTKRSGAFSGSGWPDGMEGTDDMRHLRYGWDSG